MRIADWVKRCGALLAWCAVAGQGVAAPAPEPVRVALIEGLSGSFANAGEAVSRNLLWAVERVNQRGGVSLPDGRHPLELVRFDSKGSNEEALSLLRAAIDQKIGFVMQGNSSATAAVLIDALNKQNQREPSRRAILLNYSAVDPALTNEKCSFWHFRFDAHADMRLQALTDVLAADKQVRKVYLIGQDYSFGQSVLRQARAMIAAKRPDIEIVGDELHPLGRIKDFLPYAAKIKASGAQAVLTGNWGNDLTLLIRAGREAGLDARFYTFYGNALGAPAAIGEAGVDRVLAVAEWHPNLGGAASDRFYASFRERFPNPQDDYVHMRMQAMVEMLAAAIEKAGSADPLAVARALEGLKLDSSHLGGFHHGTIRAADHQFEQPLVVSVLQRAGSPGVRFDNEGSGYGFKTVLQLTERQTEMPHRCAMERP
ncbi:branched-chain amino acid ABC transporter substrate-binding protein [Rhizobacter sp. SG703]|uniref:branched-chain amino acid ABC transporter substrate-binding protein n=1 Tax=Rhizobacter sp. SG703 TaxID=2587140 RepID=UPI001445B423|nr:branched-chain amino acid ABC transporter substrate-binding protein [Rhizobacter sp. SG703]NKI97445.1 branched-chain amino acid transport system substrate-binding protein [Rhizobacter sp. SG703]